VHAFFVNVFVAVKAFENAFLRIFVAFGFKNILE